MITLAIALASAALVLSAVLPFLLHDARLRGAFESLEDEFEDLRDTMKSHMGRISRLKRATMQASDTETGEAGDDGNSSPGDDGLTKHQREVNAKILAQRRRV